MSSSNHLAITPNHILKQPEPEYRRPAVGELDDECCTVSQSAAFGSAEIVTISPWSGPVSAASTRTSAAHHPFHSGKTTAHRCLRFGRKRASQRLHLWSQWHWRSLAY